jgi:hypothetical protein
MRCEEVSPTLKHYVQVESKKADIRSGPLSTPVKSGFTVNTGG